MNTNSYNVNFYLKLEKKSWKLISLRKIQPYGHTWKGLIQEHHPEA